MEARWMGFSFWLNIYHSWYLPWRQKQALFLTWKRASEKATGTVSSMAPKTSTFLTWKRASEKATGTAPPQPMITCLVRKTVLRNSGRTSASFGWQGLFPAQWYPPTYQIFLLARVKAGEIQYAQRRHEPLRSPWLLPWTSRLGPSPFSQQSWQQLRGFSQPKDSLIGQSVRPSKMDWTNTVSTAQKVAVRIRHQGPNGL